MDPAASSLPALEQRLRDLENSNRRLRLGALAAGLLALAACFGANEAPAAAPAGIVEADAFVLRHPDGGVAARLDFWNYGPRLVMYSAPEQEGVLLRTEPRSSELRLNAAGKRRTHLEANADLNVGRISLVHDDGKVMAQMLTEAGASNFGLWGESNKSGVRTMMNLAMPPVGPPTISLRTPDLKARVIGMDG
jgi:hypothetical protein